MVICGNKVDLESDRQVAVVEGRDLAKNFGVPFMETSAKTRVNVEESFHELVREIRKSEAKKTAGKGAGNKKGGGKEKKGCVIL